jgi:hypothetical protein
MASSAMFYYVTNQPGFVSILAYYFYVVFLYMLCSFWILDFNTVVRLRGGTFSMEGGGA